MDAVLQAIDLCLQQVVVYDQGPRLGFQRQVLGFQCLLLGRLASLKGGLPTL